MEISSMLRSKQLTAELEWLDNKCAFRATLKTRTKKGESALVVTLANITPDGFVYHGKPDSPCWELAVVNVGHGQVVLSINDTDEIWQGAAWLFMLNQDGDYQLVQRVA